MDIYVLNREFETVAVVDNYISEIWTDRYWEPGDFEIQVPSSKENLDIFKEDYYLWMAQSEHIMVIEDITLQSDAENGSTILVAGRSIESVLDRRIVWKQTSLNGDLQNAVQRILNENAISPSDSSRKISALSFKASTDEKVTSLTIDTQYTGDTVLDIIQDLCKQNDIGFKITMPSDGQWVFELYAGANRTYDQTENPYIIFSPNFENLMNSNAYSSKKDYKTVALVGGEGEGSERKMTTVSVEGGSLSDLDRRELFVDARDVSSSVDGGTLTTEQYYEKLSQRGKEKLSEYKVTNTFEGEAETSRSFQYGTDFKMGDIVQNENEYGQTFTSRITEYIWSESESEQKQYPTFTVIEKEDS